MKVKELVELLQEMDPEALVVMSEDSECCNNFNELCGASTGFWDERDGGYVFPINELTPELQEEGYYEEDDAFDGPPCVCLRPIT